MTVEELVRAIEGLSEVELRNLARRVPALRVAEARAVYQEGRDGEVKPRSPAPEERPAMSREELAARYRNPAQWTEHPWVVQVEGYNSGRPIILGTSIAVRTIVIAWLQHGMSMAEVLENWPIHEAQVYDALAYYYDHQTEVDADIEADSEERLKELYPAGKYEIV